MRCVLARSTGCAAASGISAGVGRPWPGGGPPRVAAWLVHHAARRRNGEPISTAFVESAVNEIIAKRMNNKQQMRWNRATVQPFIDVRTAELNDTFEDAFRRHYPGFRPANGLKVGAPVP
jgi:hypothetical protein